MKLRILSGGAAQGIVTALAEKLKTETGYDIDGTFSAVGAIKEKLLGGAPCDLIILSAKLIGELAERRTPGTRHRHRPGGGLHRGSREKGRSVADHRRRPGVQEKSPRCSGYLFSGPRTRHRRHPLYADPRPAWHPDHSRAAAAALPQRRDGDARDGKSCRSKTD